VYGGGCTYQGEQHNNNKKKGLRIENVTPLFYSHQCNRNCNRILSDPSHFTLHGNAIP